MFVLRLEQPGIKQTVEEVEGMTSPYRCPQHGVEMVVVYKPVAEGIVVRVCDKCGLPVHRRTHDYPAEGGS